MRIPRIFTPQALTLNTTLALEEQASSHLIRVLRLSEGDTLELFNNTDSSYLASIQSATKKSVNVLIEQQLPGDKQSPIATHLGLAMSKGDRMDYAIQKATELGVHAITPLNSERCELRLKGERAEKKVRQWQQIAISSCEQCQRNRVPEINPIENLESWVNNRPEEMKLVLHHRAEQRIQDLQKPASVAFLIGPEGGLSESEIDQAEQQGFTPLLMGPRVLRTETAPVVLLSLTQLLWGDF